LYAVSGDAAALAQNTGAITGPTYAIDTRRLVERRVCRTSETHCVNARTARLAGSWRRRTAHREYSDATGGSKAHIAEPSHAREVSATTALHAVGIPAASLSVDPARTDRNRIDAASPNALHARSARATACAHDSRAAARRVAEARYPCALETAMALNPIGSAPSSLSVDPARIARNRIGTASTYAPDAWGGNALALAEHPGAATVRIAKARHTREAAAAKAFHTVSVVPKFVAPSESPNSRPEAADQEMVAGGRRPDQTPRYHCWR
jgi:hypothetical protein